MPLHASGSNLVVTVVIGGIYASPSSGSILNLAVIRVIVGI